MRRPLILLAFLIGCGASDAKVETDPDQAADPARAAKLLDEAEKEADKANWAKARELLREAYRFSDMQTRVRIDTAGERLDDAQAKAVAAEAQNLIGEDRCGEAFDVVAATVKGSDDEQVPGILKKATEASLLGCARKIIEAGELAKARAVVTQPSARVALDKKAHAKLASELSDTIVATVLGRMTSAMDLRDWGEASKTLQAAVDAGEVGDAEREELLAQVRTGIDEDVEKLHSESFGQDKGAKAALAKVDALLLAGMWKPREQVRDARPLTTEEKMLAQGKQEDTKEDTRPPVPEKLDRLRRELAFWVACHEVKCKETAPTKRWLYGNAWLQSLFAPKAEAEESLDHAVEVWVVAEAGNLALVSQRDPGNLADLKGRAHVARGWVHAAALKDEDTSEWLPPGDSIIGARVWGPLREGSQELELGTAIKVDGASVGVERMGDKTLITVPRAQLHFGLVKPGSKVLALCKGSGLTPARVEKVTEPKHKSLGDPKAVLTCLDDAGADGDKYEEQLGAVRTKRDWLPPRK
jgi:hypothetical protein